MKAYIKKIMPFIILQIAADFICTLIASMYPYLQKQLFDSDRKLLVVVWYAVFHVLDVLLNYVCMQATWGGAVRLEKHMKHDFFKSVLGLRKKEFARRDVGTYLSWQNNDLSALEQDYLQPVIDVIRSVNMLLIYGVVVFVMVDWRIGLVLVTSSIITAAGPKLFGDRMAAKRECYQGKTAEYTSLVKDLLDGFSLVNSRTRKQYAGTQKTMLDEMCEKRKEYGQSKCISIAVNDMAVRVIKIAAFATAGILFAQGKITIGTCVAAFGYVESFLMPINSLLYDVSMIQSVSSVKKRILDFMKENPAEEKMRKKVLEKRIDLENITVSYDTFSMKGLSYTFEKGKKYALIGRSGSGKSTILSLLNGDLEPQSGTVMVDGECLEKIDAAGLISCIHQNEHIFRTDAHKNVTVFGSYPDERLPELKKCLMNPVLNQVFGKNGEGNCQEMSGGERQTLAFLRALLENTQVLLLDEPFSAVDSRTTGIYMDYLMQEMPLETTLIMVTHELSERLANFDEICLMADGKIVEKGSFDEVRRSEAYKKLVSDGTAVK